MLYNFINRLCVRFGAVFLFATAFGIARGQSSFVYKDAQNFYTPGISAVAAPYGGVTFDSSGNAFGTTISGGLFGNGCLWELASSGTFSVLHNFGGTVTNANGSSGPDGIQPICNVTVDDNGDLFGTTTQGGPLGGSPGRGMAWELTTAGAYVDLHDFGGTLTLSNSTVIEDGKNPYATLSVDSSGDIFGTASYGGAIGVGIVWEIASGGAYSDLHDFGGNVTFADGTSGEDGYTPGCGPTLDSSGDLLGTAQGGGEYSSGNVWEITSSGIYKDIHDFGGTVTISNGTSGADGAFPFAGVTLDSSGNLYGCTLGGGGVNNQGMIWELTSGAYHDMHDFGGTTTWATGASGTDGENPHGNVVFDSAGNMYGTTQGGGQFNDGIVWELTAGGAYFDQHDFGGTITYPNGSTGVDGENPVVGVTLDSSGNLWGTASGGAYFGCGLTFSMPPLAVSGLTLSPSTIVGGYSSTGTITLNAAAVRKTTISLINQWPAYVTVPESVTVMAGESSVTFTASVSKLYSATFTDLISAVLGSQGDGAFLTVTGEKLSSLSVSPTAIGGFGTSTGTVTITNPAPPGGWAVNLKSALPSYVSVPSSVTVAAGATSANFTLTGLGAHASSETCSIYATDKASGAGASITLQGDSIASLSLNQSTIGWSGTSTGTVTLNAAAPAGGWLVNLSVGASGYLSMPSSVTIPAGATSATFTITGAAQRSTDMAIRINASDGATVASAILNLTGDSLSNLSLSPPSVAPGTGSTGTITLSAPAPAGGWKVSLEVGAPSLVGVPASVTVPAGASSVTFPLTTPIGAPPTSVTIITKDGTSQEQTTLTIT